MSAREAYLKPRLPTSYYFFSLARGDKMRTFALRPFVVWAILAIGPILAVWSVGASLFIALHDQMLVAVVAREADMQYAYEDRLAEARAQLDRVASRQLLDQNSFEGKMHELLSRQAQLDQRTSVVASMARLVDADRDATGSIGERGKTTIGVKTPTTALMAIGAQAQPAADSVLDSVKAFAPTDADGDAPPRALKPRPMDEPHPGRPEHTSALADDGDQGALADLRDAAGNPEVAAQMRLSLVARSLDRMEKRQIAVLGHIGKRAAETISRLRGVMDEAGIDPSRLAKVATAAKGVGGPYIPIDVDANAPAFDKAAAHVERDLVVEDQLRRELPFAPVRRPLLGLAEVSSPFGYRTDPFLGRLALHPGVDLVQPFGAPVKATGAGRVTHAGPYGGYGNMVEVDHGGGLTTRYGHLSEILVEEGQEVKAGGVVGRIGSTGRSTGPHLHYEVRVDGEPVDPTRFLTAGDDLRETY